MDVAKLHRIAQAAEAEGVNRSTLVTAVRKVQLPSYTTACGLPLVTLADVRKWKAASGTRKPGRKPTKK